MLLSIMADKLLSVLHVCKPLYRAVSAKGEYGTIQQFLGHTVPFDQIESAEEATKRVHPLKPN